MSININITFMHISRFILVSKSTSFTFFHMNIHSHHHIFRRSFVYIHTFFHYKMMCSCRLLTCLYDIHQTSYDRRLHQNHVAPPVPIWAKSISALGNIYLQLIWAATPVLRRRDYIYRHILLGENFVLSNPHTRTWENPDRFFSRRAIICTVYCWEKCKKL